MTFIFQSYFKDVFLESFQLCSIWFGNLAIVQKAFQRFRLTYSHNDETVFSTFSEMEKKQKSFLFLTRNKEQE